MDLIGDMPANPKDWFEAFEFYRIKGRTAEWNKALAEYIHITNLPVRQGILEYARRRQGEWDREKIEDEAMFRRRAKKEEERLSAWKG